MKLRGLPAGLIGLPMKLRGLPARLIGLPMKLRGLPARRTGVLAKLQGTPAWPRVSPSKRRGEATFAPGASRQTRVSPPRSHVGRNTSWRFLHRLEISQVPEITGRIKNVDLSQALPGGAQDVGEGLVALVGVPGAHERDGEGSRARALGEPQHEGGVEDANEGRHAQDGIGCVRRRVGEAEELLCVSEKDLDSPPLGIGLDKDTHLDGGVGAEEDAERDRAVGRLDDHDAQEPHAASAIPLRAQGLVAHHRRASVDVGLAGLPRHGVVLRECPRLRQRVAAYARAADP